MATFSCSIAFSAIFASYSRLNFVKALSSSTASESFASNVDLEEEEKEEEEEIS
jgi:hypothetical protein